MISRLSQIHLALLGQETDSKFWVQFSVLTVPKIGSLFRSTLDMLMFSLRTHPERNILILTFNPILIAFMKKKSLYLHGSNDSIRSKFTTLTQLCHNDCQTTTKDRCKKQTCLRVIWSVDLMYAATWPHTSMLCLVVYGVVWLYTVRNTTLLFCNLCFKVPSNTCACVCARARGVL